jgi:hypothetical protein
LGTAVDNDSVLDKEADSYNLGEAIIPILKWATGETSAATINKVF